MNRFGVLNLIVAIGLVATSVTDAIDCNSRPDFKNARECCPHEDFSGNEVIAKCKDYLNTDDNSPPGGHGPGHKKMHFNTCYNECIMNETGLVDFETMKVDEAKTKTFLTDLLKEKPDFVQVVTDAILKCADHVKEMREKHANDPKPTLPPGGCKPCAAMFMHCIKKETTINCPTSAWKNDETCNNLREFMMVCKPPNHRGPPQ
ncbi:general odorant-binding protein 67 isoform X2 [Eupeodes corollae]|uniref:general odorant-binding protein 67 isoform X2 n=1 Tax=Eupeodes corollae TaxID=290404 RepID=UPI002492D481|nr:general odorant-binding protein 67 isoform X2 [Eupeodes corollae]